MRAPLPVVETPFFLYGAGFNDQDNQPPAAVETEQAPETGREALEQCVPSAALRFSGAPRRRRDVALLGSAASLALHGALLAAAIWLVQPADELTAGAEEAIPVEFVIAGDAIEQAASEAGAQAATVDLPPPQLPEIPPIDVARETPQVEVPPPPDAAAVEIAQPQVELPPLPEPPPVDIARETPPLVAEQAPVEAPPAVIATLDIPPPPDAPVIMDMTPPVLATETAQPTEDVVPPAHALPEPKEAEPKEAKAAESKPLEAAQPAPKQPVTKPPEVRKPPPKTIERAEKPKPRQAAPKPIAAREPAPRPVRETAPREAEAATQPGRGRGRSGAGESDQNRVASSRGGAAAVANYRARVMAHLARFKVYPEQMRERGITGRAAVSFSLSRTGQVLSAALSGSSGAPMLDQATLAAVRRASPFPSAPDGGPSVLSFSASMNYTLR
ncbi:MAG: TonB family protein [Rhizobiales bacterium]|nr:TonB family protein [Hyphomicrobiales bacterium]